MLFRMKAAKFVAALAMLLSSAVPLAALNNTSVSSAGGDCSGNSVMHCGAVSVPNFDSKLANGDGVNSASELQQVYGSWGITAGTMAGVVSGVVTRGGDVIVGGKVVATGAESVGRDFKAGSHRDPRSGLWMRPTSIIFSQPSLTAWVNMSGGVFHWAVLDSCGNMVGGHPTPPPPPKTVACLSLTPKSSQGSAPLTVTYTAVAEEQNAHIKAFRFNFDNGNVVTKPAIQQAGGKASAQATTTFNNPNRNLNPFVLVESDLGVTQRTAACTASVSTAQKPQVTFACINLAASPREGRAPLTVNFDAKGTATNAKVTSFKFVFDGGNGDTRTVPAVQRGGGVATGHTSFTYQNPGVTHNPFVLVNTTAGTTNKVGPCEATVVTRPVTPPPPTFACTGLTATKVSGQAPLAVTFTGHGTATNTKLTGYFFNFGNGQTKLVNVNGQTSAQASTVYQKPGTYTATVLVHSAAGNEQHVNPKCKLTITVTKTPPPPPVFACDSLTGQPTSGEAPLTVKFTAKASATRTNIESYNYNFDANKNNVIDLINHTSATTNTAMHTYNVPGKYTAIVTVTTGAGATKVISKCSVPITVTKPPVNRNFACTGLTGDQTSGPAPLTVNFVATASVNNTQVQKYIFNFGDNHTAQVKTSALSANVTHVYQDSGDFLATVQVNTKAGTTPITEQCELAIHVSSPPPGQGGGGTPPAETPSGEIPATGSGALGFAGFTGVGFLGYYLRKRNLLNLLG